VRMALGAQPRQIRTQFFSLSLRLLAGGMLLGLIGAWQAGRAMRTVLSTYHRLTSQSSPGLRA
jgi:ABC-type antimicrobial peptide transport system permease subunit